MSAELKSTGEMARSEVVHYLSRLLLGVPTAVKELVGFAEVMLTLGERQTVNATVLQGRLAVIPGDVLGETVPGASPKATRSRLANAARAGHLNAD